MELKELLVKLITESQVIVDEHRGRPCVVDKAHERYDGYDCILIGNDTEVRESDNGMFKVTSYHSSFEPFEANAFEVIEFYRGVFQAYGLLMVEDSIFYKKGFVNVMKRQIETIEEQLFS